MKAQRTLVRRSLRAMCTLAESVDALRPISPTVVQGSTPLRWRCGLCKHTARKNHIYEHWGLHVEVEPYLDQVVLNPKPKARSAAAAGAVKHTGSDSDGADGLMELAFAVEGSTHQVADAREIEGCEHGGDSQQGGDGRKRQREQLVGEPEACAEQARQPVPHAWAATRARGGSASLQTMHAAVQQLQERVSVLQQRVEDGEQQLRQLRRQVAQREQQTSPPEHNVDMRRPQELLDEGVEHAKQLQGKLEEGEQHVRLIVRRPAPRVLSAVVGNQRLLCWRGAKAALASAWGCERCAPVRWMG